MANKDKKNKTSFDFGNTAAEKWTKKEASTAFEEIFKYALDNETCLCLQDSYLKNKMLGSTFYYLIEKYPVLETYKKDIQDVIISRINQNALTSEYNATASIWRMKQSGENDRQEVTQTTTHEFKGDPFAQIRKNAGIDESDK